MNNSPNITPEEWERIRKYIADGPQSTFLHTDETGTCVLFNGGVMHPRAYLQIMEEDESPGEPIDILKHTGEGSLKLEDVTMPGSLSGVHSLPRWKPKPPDTE